VQPPRNDDFVRRQLRECGDDTYQRKSAYALAMCGIPDLGAYLACAELMELLCDPYRPEQHYMRGPGPKYRAKHRT
jgi:hypothetical protein